MASSLVSEGMNQIPWVLRVAVVVNSYKLLVLVVSNDKRWQEPDSVGADSQSSDDYYDLCGDV